MRVSHLGEPVHEGFSLSDFMVRQLIKVKCIMLNMFVHIFWDVEVFILKARPSWDDIGWGSVYQNTFNAVRFKQCVIYRVLCKFVGLSIYTNYLQRQTTVTPALYGIWFICFISFCYSVDLSLFSLPREDMQCRMYSKTKISIDICI